MNTNNAIEIRGLVKNYPTFKLGPLDLTVPRGAIYGLIGPNGAGKTTVIDLIFGMGRNDAGTIRVLGLDHPRPQSRVSHPLDGARWLNPLCLFYPHIFYRPSCFSTAPPAHPTSVSLGAGGSVSCLTRLFYHHRRSHHRHRFKPATRG